MTYPSAADTKKVVLAVSLCTVVLCGFASCKNVGRDDRIAPTTTVTDINGITHYYEIISNDSQESESTGILAEIATDKNGEPITTRSGEYVTAKATAVITTATDDNDIPFDDTDEPTTTETIPKTEHTTLSESPTDSEGWINRWY